MANDLRPAMESDLPAAALPRRWAQSVELTIFLFLIVPSMIMSLFITRQGGLSFVPVAVMTILRDLALVSLILYFLWRNGEALRRIGWDFRHRGWDVLLGVLLFVPVFFGAAWLDSALQSIGFSAPQTPTPAFLEARGRAETVLAIALVLVVALAEETIFRGYLILRFQPLAGIPLAIVLSSAVFALGHGYEGTSGLVTVGMMGVVLAGVYVWRQSLVAPIVMHFLQDFISILVIPIFFAKH